MPVVLIPPRVGIGRRSVPKIGPGYPRRVAARPFCERLDGPAEPLEAVRWLRGEPGAVALSGAWAGGGLLLSSHPLRVAGSNEDPFALLQAGAPAELDRASAGGGAPAELDRTSAGDEAAAGGAAVGGGWFGYLGFGLARAIERLPAPPPRPDPLPPFQLAFHDHLVRCDSDGRWFFEALWSDQRDAVLGSRLELWRGRLAGGQPRAPEPVSTGPLRIAGPGGAGHQVAVAEAIERIAAGDLSQVNVCTRFEGDLAADPLELWLAGVASSGPAHAAYFAGESGRLHGTGEYAVASLSPELFLRRRGRHVETRPIKGTAPIDSDPELLRASPKDRAENLMIVDLMRNDLGRVCEYGSVAATALCEVEPAAGVWHLVSTVEGTLRPDVGDGELLQATFPPGSVTGAPKVQALRMIHELEQTAREVFCGAVGLASPLSGLELGVAIRTLEVSGRRLWVGVGGGVVSDSTPDGELAEALAKARGVATAAGLDVEAPAAGLGVEAAAAGLGVEAVATAGPRARVAPVAPITALPRPEPASGVFETIRVIAGRPVAAAEHLARLTSSCAALGLAAPGDLGARIERAAAELDGGVGGVRVAVSERGVALSTREPPGSGASSLTPVVLPGGLGPHKWLDRRLVDALSGPGATPLLCDLDGEVLEAGYGAVLLLSGETLVATPIDRRRLDSVSRRRALDAARAIGLAVEVRAFTLAHAREADAIVLTSSLRGPHPGSLPGGPPADAAATVCSRLAAGEQL
jgi:para-aminobenzoate synthetase/4-amino-4-deoxychorismate lyase